MQQSHPCCTRRLVHHPHPLPVIDNSFICCMLYCMVRKDWSIQIIQGKLHPPRVWPLSDRRDTIRPQDSGATFEQKIKSLDVWSSQGKTPRHAQYHSSGELNTLNNPPYPHPSLKSSSVHHSSHHRNALSYYNVT